MPTYEYKCTTCDERFELRRPMAESNSPAPCPHGHVTSKRLLSAFASVGATSASSPVTQPQGCGGACACAPH